MPDPDAPNGFPVPHLAGQPGTQPLALAVNVACRPQPGLESGTVENPDHTRDLLAASRQTTRPDLLAAIHRIRQLPPQSTDPAVTGRPLDWPAADLTGIDLNHADLQNADLSDMDLTAADLSNADLAGASLSSANLPYADLSDANMTSADLTFANLSHADLTGTDLSYADLRLARMGDAKLRDAKMCDAQVDFVHLVAADLSSAGLSGASLISARLMAASLIAADLGHAVLREVDLRGADLSHANLRDADLRGADLSYADLSGADLLRVRLPPLDMLIAVRWSTETQWGRRTDEIRERSIARGAGRYVLNPSCSPARAIAAPLMHCGTAKFAPWHRLARSTDLLGELTTFQYAMPSICTRWSRRSAVHGVIASIRSRRSSSSAKISRARQRAAMPRS